MADVILHPTTSALWLQDLQNELIKGNRPVVPLSGAALLANCQKLLTKARAVGMPVIIFPRMAWVASVDEVTHAMRG